MNGNEEINRSDGTMSLDKVTDTILKAERKRDKILAVAVFAIIFMAVFFIWYAVNAEKRQIQIIKEYSTAERTFKYNDLGWQGQKDQYRQLMMSIFRVYGKSYNNRDVRALSPDEKPQYIDLCFNLAKDLGQPLTEWTGPIFGIMESSLNPNALGDFITRTTVKKIKKGKKTVEKEIDVKIPTSFGMYQIKKQCGDDYLKFYDMQPNWFKKKYPVHYVAEEDALKWKDATILMYCGIWGAYNKTYKGVHRFAISSHRFGPILKWYFNDGNGKLPHTFTYIVDGDKVSYPVSDYWTDYLGMKEAFEAGDIELGKPFRLHWEGVRKKIAEEERQFSRNYNTFKYFKQEIDKLKQEKNDRDKRILELEEDIDDTYKKFVATYGEIHEGNYKTVSTVFDKAKGTIKEWMKKYADHMKQAAIVEWIITVIIMLLCTTVAAAVAVDGFRSWFVKIRSAVRKLIDKYILKKSI